VIYWIWCAIRVEDSKQVKSVHWEVFCPVEWDFSVYFGWSRTTSTTLINSDYCLHTVYMTISLWKIAAKYLLAIIAPQVSTDAYLIYWGGWKYLDLTEKISAGRIIISSKEVHNLYRSGSFGVSKLMRIRCADEELCMEVRCEKYVQSFRCITER
jgi:hypothetical protein